MVYLLDTNAAISLLERRSATLLVRAASVPERSIGLSAIVAFELIYGALKSAKVSLNLERIRLFMSDVPALQFTADDARVAGEIRAALAARGTPIGPYDLLIAGQAKARDLTLVTNNVREFARVEGLRIEDWSAPR